MSRKSLLSLLLVMIMACCAVFTAGAESFLPGADSAFSVSAGIEINQDGFNSLIAKTGASTASMPPELMNAVFSIINNTTIKATVKGNAAQCEVLMKDTPIINIAGQVADDGLTIVTDLLPNYAVYISNEEIQKLMEQLQASMAASGISFDINPDDIQYIASVVIAQATPVITKIMTSFGPEESGEWTFDGASFTTRQPLNMTTKELLTSVMEAVSNIVSDAKVQSIVGGFGIKPEQLDVSSAVESLKNTNEADLPAMTFYKYGGSGSDSYFTLELAQNGQGFVFQGGLVGGVAVCHISSNPKMFTLDANIQENGEFNIDFVFDIAAASNNSASPISVLEVIVNGASSGDAYNVNVKYLLDQTDLLTMKMLFEQGGEITASFDKTGKKVLGIQEIVAIAQGTDTETLNALKGEITTVAMTLIGKLAGIFPNEITQLMTVVQTLNR